MLRLGAETFHAGMCALQGERHPSMPSVDFECFWVALILLKQEATAEFTAAMPGGKRHD
jgi:hypothetical protein